MKKMMIAMVAMISLYGVLVSSTSVLSSLTSSQTNAPKLIYRSNSSCQSSSCSFVNTDIWDVTDYYTHQPIPPSLVTPPHTNATIEIDSAIDFIIDVGKNKHYNFDYSNIYLIGGSNILTIKSSSTCYYFSLSARSSSSALIKVDHSYWRLSHANIYLASQPEHNITLVNNANMQVSQTKLWSASAANETKVYIDDTSTMYIGGDYEMDGGIALRGKLYFDSGVTASFGSLVMLGRNYYGSSVWLKSHNNIRFDSIVYRGDGSSSLTWQFDVQAAIVDSPWGQISNPAPISQINVMNECELDYIEISLVDGQSFNDVPDDQVYTLIRCGLSFNNAYVPKLRRAHVPRGSIQISGSNIVWFTGRY